ncbi:MAG: DNA methylase [Clostridia bacterium]|nr:DNA methylase [Clostridia bacterium]
MAERTYISIDLKSFYASVECAERGLDPMTANLVVADASRTEKTICLAVSPALKSYGIPGRARLFEVVQAVERVNALRLEEAIRNGTAVRCTEDAENGTSQGRRRYRLRGESKDSYELSRDPSLAVAYHIAPPRMQKYMEYSSRIFRIYMRFVAPEDIHVYSVDECFIDVTNYLKTYGLTARELAMKMIRTVLAETGITATCGIGTNLYLAKIAMDIEAKHIPADADGVRIAELDEQSYRRRLWTHMPLTDFWRVGRGIADKLEKRGIYTMGDIARTSVDNEELLYRLFGVNAELLIDHAWGVEPCTIPDIKAFKPEGSSLGSAQVLSSPYPFAQGRIIVKEMADTLALQLKEKHLVADSVVLTVNYDMENCASGAYTGPTVTDRYGRQVPKEAHGSKKLGCYTNSVPLITETAAELFCEIADPRLTIRRISVVANHTVPAAEAPDAKAEQLDLFTDYAAREAEREKEQAQGAAILEIKKKFGKNAILKGVSLREGATMQQRNGQIGGHKA